MINTVFDVSEPERLNLPERIWRKAGQRPYLCQVNQIDLSALKNVRSVDQLS